MIAAVTAVVLTAALAAVFFQSPARREEPVPELECDCGAESDSPVLHEEKSYIKWVDFDIPSSLLEKAMRLDIDTYGTDRHVSWIDMLAYLACKCGGNFKAHRTKDWKALVQKLDEGQTMEQLAADMEYYSYYQEAYTAILGGFLGEFDIELDDPEHPGEKKWMHQYGLKAYSPIAEGYSYGDYDDFGSSRSYGYKRRHLGHDMMGSVGTPIVAVESGIVEALGWNQYGGWRIGIRSFDTKRYYYYAHLRRDHPYQSGLSVGSVVQAGDVIGYLGMTGYSQKENVNNINTPHLHFGMQIIFDESQKEGNGEIWIDVYDITQLLKKHRSTVAKDEQTREYTRVYRFRDPVTGHS
nr:M23 family metallopeptidase [Feifania hominis]